MKLLNPPQQYIAEHGDTKPYIELIQDACITGEDNIGGYAVPITGKHAYIRGNGKVPTDNFDELQNDEKYDSIIISDCKDLDGVAATAVYKHVFDNPLIFYNASDPQNVLEEVLNCNPNLPTYVVDHQPSPAEEWNKYVDGIEEFYIRDHHPYVSDLQSGVDYAHSENASATEIALNHDATSPPSHLQKLADATTIRDLWQTDSPDFEKYSLLDIAADVCVRPLLSSKLEESGTGILTQPSFFQVLKNINYERWLRADWLLRQQDYNDQRSVNGVTIRTIYGHTPDTSLLCHEAMEQFNVDIAVNVMPVFGSDGMHTISLRATETHPAAQDIAKSFNGGGHRTASGASIALRSEQPEHQVQEAAAAIEGAYRTLTREKNTTV